MYQWKQRLDSNQRFPGYGPDEMTIFSTLQCVFIMYIMLIQYIIQDKYEDF